jgi:hypothetical protein
MSLLVVWSPALNAVAVQPYEGRNSVGCLLLARQDHPAVDIWIRFVEPVPVSAVRAFRKVLEMSDTDTDHQLLCDRGEV